MTVAVHAKAVIIVGMHMVAGWAYQRCHRYRIRANTTNVSPSTLNRHHIMHGGSTEYATKINCLKLISLIGSLDWLISKMVEAGPTKTKLR